MTTEQQPGMPAPIDGPVVVKHAAFTVTPETYDELARLLRAREFHHVFDTENGAIYMDHIALVCGGRSRGS